MKCRAAAALLVVALGLLAGAAESRAQADGETLYLRDCAWCHGPGGEGTNRGPGLDATGEAEAFYYLSTGRMPIEEPRRPERGEPAYDDDELDALVAHVAGLGDGPDLPDVDAEDGDLVRGGELYRINCASCHGFAGAGGALSGRPSPPVTPASAREALAATVAGPADMPSFDAFDGGDLADVTAYVAYLGDPEHAGGTSLGAVGPLAEGLLAAAAGLFLLVLVRWGIAGWRRRA